MYSCTPLPLQLATTTTTTTTTAPGSNKHFMFPFCLYFSVPTLWLPAILLHVIVDRSAEAIPLFKQHLRRGFHQVLGSGHCVMARVPSIL